MLALDDQGIGVGGVPMKKDLLVWIKLSLNRNARWCQIFTIEYLRSSNLDDVV